VALTDVPLQALAGSDQAAAAMGAESAASCTCLTDLNASTVLASNGVTCASETICLHVKMNEGGIGPCPVRWTDAGMRLVKQRHGAARSITHHVCICVYWLFFDVREVLLSKHAFASALRRVY
jgi:hypothetical protein